LSIFVDSSVWFAAAVRRDRDNELAKSILASTRDHVTTDHVLVETWLLLNSRFRREVAESFWSQIRAGGVAIEFVAPADLEAAWAIGAAFPDQDFSIVDRTSFALTTILLSIVMVARARRHSMLFAAGTVQPFDSSIRRYCSANR
jgi:predicted nucleic acid-binding protein